MNQKITNVELDKNTIIERDLLDDKLGILDIKATINANSRWKKHRKKNTLLLE